jgi:hypothetical protein
VAGDEWIDGQDVYAARRQLFLDLLIDRLGDAGAIFGLGGDDAALVAAGIDVEPPGNMLGLDAEPLGRCMQAPLGLLGRILEVVEPDGQRSVVDSATPIRLPLRGHAASSWS